MFERLRDKNDHETLFSKYCLVLSFVAYDIWTVCYTLFSALNIT